MKRILIFANGSQDPDSTAGSGFRQIVEDVDLQTLDAEICGAVAPFGSNVLDFAFQHKIWSIPWLADLNPTEQYHAVVIWHQPDLIVLAGWQYRLQGLDWINPPIVNCHPAPLPEFGGKGMYGLRPHEMVLASGRQSTAMTIHWVNAQYDAGDIIFECPIPILSHDTPVTLQTRVKQYEHWYYGLVIQLMLQGLTRVELSDLPAPPDSWFIS